MAHEFELFLGLLFGGDGRLVLTEPDDLLASGVEIEARLPAGSVRRLSLLSGGERSLVALAFYFAIFLPAPLSLRPRRGRGRLDDVVRTASSTCSTTPASTPGPWSSATSAAPWRRRRPHGVPCRPRA